MTTGSVSLPTTSNTTGIPNKPRPYTLRTLLKRLFNPWKEKIIKVKESMKKADFKNFSWFCPYSPRTTVSYAMASIVILA